jgi:hypothetical protein
LIKDGTFGSELSDDKEVKMWLKNLGQLAKLDVSELEMAIENEPSMREKVEDFFESVQNEGERVDEYLPDGWLLKTEIIKINGIARENAIHFVTESGTKLKSRKAAAIYMEANANKYSKEDIKKVYLTPDGKNHRIHTASENEWKANEYLPEGWKGKETKHGVGLMTQDGTRFTSYLVATEYMQFVGDYSQQQIDRIYLYPDGSADNLHKRQKLKSKQKQAKKRRSNTNKGL